MQNQSQESKITWLLKNKKPLTNVMRLPSLETVVTPGIANKGSVKRNLENGLIVQIRESWMPSSKMAMANGGGFHNRWLLSTFKNGRRLTKICMVTKSSAATCKI